ncbi:MAG: RND transporter [Gallionellales bacterium GWA2_59_43]|nr:MAG: RND transporter [Gallionellales bacterium GWA2_59_43]
MGEPVGLKPDLRTGAVILLAALLAGCSMAPTYQRPEAPVTAAWPANVKLKLSGELLRSDRWQDYFAEPRLQGLIAAALEHNRDLRIATARIAEARAQYGIVQADRLPNVNATAGRNASLTPAGASAFTPNAIHSQRYDVGLSLLSFELDFWGRVASLNDAAKASYLATEEAQRAFRLSLIADVANAYLSLLELSERAELAASTAKTRAEYRELTMRRREMGVSSDMDYLQAEGAYQAALAEQANLERQQAAAANLLDLLVGHPVAQLKELPSGRPLAGQDIGVAQLAELPAEALLRRPDVLAAEQRLIAANANIGAARAAFLPRVTLTGSVGTASRTLAGLFDPGSGAWSFQPSIVMPLFDAGRNSSNLDVAEARKVIAVADYEKTLQQAFREVADLLNAREQLAAQLAAQQANAAAQAQRLKLVEARYQVGIANHLELLDAQRESFAAQQGALQVRRLQLATATQLYKALARGTEDAPAKAEERKP